jgi:hypothetical protein
MQIHRRFLPLPAVALMGFAMASSLRAQGVDDSNGTRLADLNSVLQADSARRLNVGDPFTKLFAIQADDSAAVGGYPASPQMHSSSSSSWAPTHFEIEGMAQWRNLNQSVNISTTNTGFNLSRDLGLSGQTPGFLFRFLWTPGKKILGAKSQLRVEYGQITRTNTRTLTGEINFEDVVYPVGAALQAQDQTKSFEVAYSPMWGNDKFRIGPLFVFQDLIVNVKLTGATLSSQTPTTVASNNSDFVFQLGFNFDLTPVKQVDLYGFLGAIPCCGGGWTGTQSEFGLKYYLNRSFSIVGGVRQGSLTFSSTVGPITVNGETFGPVHGTIGWSGVGPFIGATYRF